MGGPGSIPGHTRIRRALTKVAVGLELPILAGRATT